MKSAIEEKAIENGHLTFENFQNIFAEREARLLGNIQSSMDGAVNKMQSSFRGTEQRTDMSLGLAEQSRIDVDEESSTRTDFREYRHGENAIAYFVPEGYALPEKSQLLPAFRMWVNGDVGNEVCINDILVKQPVRPLYLWTVDRIPTELWKKFKAGWHKILDMMMEAPELHELKSKIDREGGTISEEVMAAYFEQGLRYVHSRVEYIAEKKRGWRKWTVTTWSKQVNYRQIQHEGTDADRGRLPVATEWNKKHVSKRSWKRKTSTIPDPIETQRLAISL